MQRLICGCYDTFHDESNHRHKVTPLGKHWPAETDADAIRGTCPSSTLQSHEPSRSGSWLADFRISLRLRSCLLLESNGFKEPEHQGTLAAIFQTSKHGNRNRPPDTHEPEDRRLSDHPGPLTLLQYSVAPLIFSRTMITWDSRLKELQSADHSSPRPSRNILSPVSCA